MQSPSTEAGAARAGFVGRRAELARAVEALDRPGAMLVVEGEPGIGKTRLLHEVMQIVPAVERLHMACPPLDEPFPLGPVVDALRRRPIDGLRLTPLTGALRPLLPEWSAHLPEEPAPLDDAAATRHRVFRALTEVVDRLGVELLVLDDAHWADASTVEWLLSLAADQHSRLRFAIGSRTGDVADSAPLMRLVSGTGAATVPTRVRLDALTPEETRDLVTSVLGVREVSAEFVTWLHDRTDGVPLAVEETLRLLRDRGDVVFRDGEWERCAVEDIDVPPTVRDSVLERVARLPGEARVVLVAASVLVDPATEDELRAVSGLAQQAARQGVAAALGADLLREDSPGSYAFRHQLAARAVEETTPVSERRRLHAAAATALRTRTTPPLARLSRHYREADDRAAWSANAEAAALLAVQSGDDDAAVAWLLELLETVDHPATERLRFTRLLGEVAARGPASLGDTGARVTSVLRRVVDEVEEPRAEVAEVRLRLGRLLLQLGEFDRAADEIETAAGGLESGSVGAAKAAISLAWPRGHGWPAERHRTWLRRAGALAAAVPAGLDRIWLDVDRASVLLVLGDEEGWEVAEELRAGPHATEEERRHVARLLLNMGHVAVAWGRDEQARRCLDEAVATMAATGYQRLLNSARLTLSHLDWHRGAWSGLADRVRALADADATLPEARLEAVLTLAQLELAGGQRSASERDLLRVHKELVRRGVTDSQPGPAASLGRLYLAEGDVQRALDVTAPIVDTIARKEMWLWASDLVVAHVDALLAAGDHAAAAAAVRDFERGTKVACAPAPHAALLVLRGAVERASGDNASAAGTLRDAALAWSEIGRPYAALLAGERQGGVELAAGDRDGGLRRLRSVERGLRTLGARWDADRVARGLRDEGVPVDRVWRGGRRGYGSDLSPRELEVARLVAEGLSNRQVADALFLSPRTVERHLGAAMRKLGISGRATLARLAAERGLEGDAPWRP